MKTPHTLGDWRIGKRGGKTGVGAIYGPKGEEIAVFSGMLSPDEELANARLIAEAPEMLDTLQAIRNDSQAFLDGKSDIDPYELAEAIRSACEVSIARATQP